MKQTSSDFDIVATIMNFATLGAAWVMWVMIALFARDRRLAKQHQRYCAA